MAVEGPKLNNFVFARITGTVAPGPVRHKAQPRRKRAEIAPWRDNSVAPRSTDALWEMLCRNRFCARFAKRSASSSPAMIASIICWLETPNAFEAAELGLMCDWLRGF